MFKPLLAATLDSLEDLTDKDFPLILSPKLDGIRCLIVNGKPVTRNMKPIPNHYIREALTGLPSVLDGELIVGNTFSDTSSAVMSEQGCPDFKYFVFDFMEDPSEPYQIRISKIPTMLNGYDKRIRLLESFTASWPSEVSYQYNKYCNHGYEGIILRKINGIYKYGRSTRKEGILLKLKPTMDDEAIVLEAHERLTNLNEATKDALGRTERSSKKAGLVPSGTLGSFTVALASDRNLTFDIGSGLNDEQRNEIWASKSRGVGRTITFTYQGMGSNGRPRFPIFKGFREDLT